MSIDTFLLPDFLTCLRYSILAEKSFICLNKKNSGNQLNGDGTPILENTNKLSGIKNNNDTSFVTLVKRTIEKYGRTAKFVDKIHVLSSIDEKSIKQELRYPSKNETTIESSSHFTKNNPSISFKKDNNESKILSCAEKKQIFEIFIIPEINRLTNKEQRILAKCMRYSTLNDIKRIFIGIVEWKHWSDENQNDRSRVAYQEILKSPIIISDWLRNKFWIACHSPKVESLDSSLSSGYYSENESTPDDFIANDLLENEYRSIWSKLPQVHMESSLQRYLLDVMVHLRTHRLTYHAKGGGAHSNSVKDISMLSKLMSLDSNKMFVTPRELKQAMFWYYPIHIVIINHISMDSSILYGSKIKLVEEFLNKVGKVKEIKTEEFENPFFIESLVIKDVINKVVPPV